MSKKNLSRADRVRERRRKQRAQKIDEMPIYKPVEPIRPSNATTFIGPKKRKPQVRTFELNTAVLPKTRTVAPSADFQMPSIEWRAASAFLAILLSIALYLMWTSPYFMVTTPQIIGNQFVASDEIIEALDMDGTTIFALQPKKVGHELLLAHPSLKAVEITVSLPNVVSVAVTERQPVLIWQQDGGMAWIDEEGVAFLAHGQTEGLITVNALGRPPAPAMDESTRNLWAPPAYLDPDVVAALRALVPYVPQGAAITYDPSVGLGWRDPRGWTVELGDMTEDFGLKLRLYETISNWIVANNIRPVLINVAYPNAPYYRTEP
jgi:hypothetical protein